MRYWPGLFAAILLGCQSAPPATLAPQALPPPLSAQTVSASSASISNAPAKGSDVRLASFESDGKTEIEIRMPQLAQIEPIEARPPALPPKPLSTPTPEVIPPAPLPSASRGITIDEALAIALAQNPDLAVNRQEMAVAEAQRVTANTYPFNPVFEAQVQAADNYGLKAHIRQSYSLLQEIETGGKGKFRRGGANAAVQRTGWELRARELATAADVYRRFQAVLAARQKLELLRETSRLNQQLAENAAALLQAGKVSGADLVIAQQEALDSRQAEAVAESELRLARLELQTALGISEPLQLEPQGELRLSPPTEYAELNSFVQAALAAQPEIFAKMSAFQQADAAVGLAIANQKANVTFGPTTEVDEAETFFIGATLQVPLQVYNKKEGEVMQAEAERSRAAAELEQSRIKVKMAVLTAWQQYEDARRVAAMLAEVTLPQSERYLRDAEKLLAAGQIDLLKLVELRRRHLAARQQLVDAENQMVLRQIDLETLSGRLLRAAHDASETHLPPPPVSP
jgi:cobalt-zinc-cadmium efflux system outer membrane protein